MAEVFIGRTSQIIGSWRAIEVAATTNALAACFHSLKSNPRIVPSTS
jgi:hypothetical protein